MSITIYDICQDIPKLNKQGKFDVLKHRRGEETETVVDDIKPKRPPTEEGLHTFTPEELLSIRVPVLEVNSRVQGYQRPFSREHARKMAVAMRQGKPFPLMEIALDGNGIMYAVDCQHRAVAGVLAKREVEGVVRRMTKDQQRELFAGQRKAKPVDRNVLILAGSGPYEEYIQDAVTSGTHAWAQIVSANPSSKTRISPYAMHRLLGFYVGNAAQVHISPAMEERWDEKAADELAPLIACFGNKQVNPLAFRPSALLGIGVAAMYVFRRNERLEKGDHERWLTHMAVFPWDRHMFVRSQQDFTFHLISHWNKRLHASRKVVIS